jgi:hypothetical protein
MGRVSARDGRRVRANRARAVIRISHGRSSCGRHRRGRSRRSIVAVAIEFVAAPIFFVVLVLFFFVLGDRCRNVARTAAGAGTTGAAGARERHRHELARAPVKARRVCARDARTITRLCKCVCVGGGGIVKARDGLERERKQERYADSQSEYCTGSPSMEYARHASASTTTHIPTNKFNRD